MNQLLKITIACVSVFGVVYLLGVFIAWDLNPKEWEGAGRFCAVFFSLLFSALAVKLITDDET